MQRVRIGLTGLACVFLLVLLAAAMLGLIDDKDGGEATRNAALVEKAQNPREPLAELGVAPGNAPDGTTNSTQALPLSAGGT